MLAYFVSVLGTPEAVSAKRTSPTARIAAMNPIHALLELAIALDYVKVDRWGSEQFGEKPARGNRRASLTLPTSRVRKVDRARIREEVVAMATSAEDVRKVYEEPKVSDWLTVDQKRIDQFGEATMDLDWMHVDPERA